MTISDIVQRLLDEDSITTEEAVLLLKAEIEINKPIEPFYTTPPVLPRDEWLITCNDKTISATSNINPIYFQKTAGTNSFVIKNNSTNLN